ncbi:MAG: sensor histidine kinase [Acidobacteriota bacterium]|nr:sensor histidine kinase [Acidobacteriota bacterium]
MSVSTKNPGRTGSRWAMIWIAYTGFLFIDPIMEPSLYLWLGTLAVFALFLVVFYMFFRCSDQIRPARPWMIAATMALGLISFPWNPGASTFFVYASAFLPFSLASFRRIGIAFAGEVLLVIGEGYIFRVHHGFLHIAWPNTVMAIFLMCIVGGGNVFFAQQRRADMQLRAAHDENVALAAVAERERIARDLHDVLGHTLSVIVLKAELANRLIQRDQASDHQRAAAEIADVERIARTSLAEVREAIGGYRTRGLAAEIDAARKTLDAAAVMLTVDSDAAGATQLTAAEETALSLALREAVTNIVRHARATTCKLRLVTVEGRRRLVVEDNGEHAVAREGNGLRGMRERIESLGGRLSLERDHGTRLLIELPLRAHTDVTQAAS